MNSQCLTVPFIRNHGLDTLRLLCESCDLCCQTSLSHSQGEPSFGGWPHVSSTFGALDLAGFPKAAASWFRTWWLLDIPDSSPDKPFPSKGNDLVHIVQSWEAPKPVTQHGNQTFAVDCSEDSRFLRFSFSGSGTQSGTLKNNDTGLCVDATCANISSSQCSELKLIECNGVPGQQFLHSDPGPFTNVGNQGCLDIWSGGQGPNVGVWKCDGQSGQNWTITDEGLIKSQAGQCLSDTETTATSGAIQVYTNLPEVKLVVNGKDMGSQAVVSPKKGRTQNCFLQLMNRDRWSKLGRMGLHQLHGRKY